MTEYKAAQDGVNINLIDSFGVKRGVVSPAFNFQYTVQIEGKAVEPLTFDCQGKAISFLKAILFCEDFKTQGG